MIDIHPDDLEAILKVTGWRDVSEKVRRDYDMWIRMKHRAGFPGPLGILLVPFLRSQNARPKEEPERTEPTRWSTVDFGQVVQVFENGILKEGKFAGMMDGGMLGVRINGEAIVREFAQTSVQLLKSGISPDIDIASMQPDVYEEPDNRIAMLEPKHQEEEVQAIEAQEPEAPFSPNAVIDTSILAIGDEVMVEREGVVHDATIAALDGEDHVLVDIDGVGNGLKFHVSSLSF